MIIKRSRKLFLDDTCIGTMPSKLPYHRVGLPARDAYFITLLEAEFALQLIVAHVHQTKGYVSYHGHQVHMIKAIIDAVYSNYMSGGEPAIPPIPSLSTVIIESLSSPDNNVCIVRGRVTDNGDDGQGGPAEVTAMGFMYSTTDPDVLSDVTTITIPTNSMPNPATSASFSATFNASGTVHIKAFATNATGTSYSNISSIMVFLCLLEGTMITLADYTTKPIENITASDSILVWDFDHGDLTSAELLWFQHAELTKEYKRLTFSSGETLNVVGHHRIFNCDHAKFTPAMSDETPIGTKTMILNHLSQIKESELIKHEVISEQKPLKYYNLITDYHMNCFANGVLTSCRYSNLFPIDLETLTYKTQSMVGIVTEPRHPDIPEVYWKGLRLHQQHQIPIDETIKYVNRLIRTANST
jgi:hypothetical protein